MLKKKLEGKMSQKKQRGRIRIVIVMAVCGLLVGLAGCRQKREEEEPAVSDQEAMLKEQEDILREETTKAVNFERKLDEYQPLKTEYNFYFTYKTVHPWWDAVALGIEDAAKQYEEMGVMINYEYLAPNYVSAQDQIQRLSEASLRNFDVLGVDVADVELVTPVINRLVENGEKVMTFSSSDASKEEGCNRIAYVGNTHNYEDGAALTETICEKLGYQGKIAVLVGTRGAPCHEDRALGVQDVIAKYPDMEIVEIAYDEDSVDKAYDFTRSFLARHSDLSGIVCCNMSNPVGAARAVVEAGRKGEIVIVGMDHDQEALQYLKDGVIYALGVQDCYSIGFDTLQVAVKIADGHLPGEAYPEKTEEITTIILQEEASTMLRLLYGEYD
ncbi:MAG: sugar ABC transporter substrate-binding protein [Lachnospiraceae bacterium]|jgi:ribose transport system substrate-binding protein|nr:sugar ABC transporter substrate-binding protein [Lachnospiraceae bacterium]